MTELRKKVICMNKFYENNIFNTSFKISQYKKNLYSNLAQHAMKFEYFFGLIDQNKKKLQVKTNLSFF